MSATDNPLLAGAPGSPGIAPWAQSQNGWALYDLAVQECGRGGCSNEYFYVLAFESHIHSDHLLVKIGITKNIIRRIGHHRSSFPGWRIVLAMESFGARDVEKWWKKFLQPWRYKGSPGVFFLPELEYRFLCCTAGWFSLDSDLALNALTVIRDCPPEKRFAHLAEIWGFAQANASASATEAGQ